jgi:hypothetical protein
MAAKNPKHPRLNNLEKFRLIPHPPFLAYLWWLLFCTHYCSLRACHHEKIVASLGF